MSEVIESNYIVYEVTYKKRVVYVGMGEPGRENHAMSGASGNKHLNELYFRDKENMSVQVLRTDLTKEEALDCERDFIMASEPEFNTIHNQKKYKVKKFRKYTI